MINRNLANDAQTTYKLKRKNNQKRKLRTHTLIQIGGLVSLSGLLEQCNIMEGEDLQHDFEGYEKGATLLGILMEASESIFEQNDEQQMKKFKDMGVRKMKQAAAKYF